MSKKIEVQNNQTIYDIAIQEYGDVEGVKQILNDNPGIDLDVDIVPKSILIIGADPINKEVVEYLKIHDIKPANKE